jgi:hypothetical protein
MKNCPTSNMNRSKLWGFEVSQIVASFFVLAGSNVTLNILGLPLIFSWVTGILTLVVLRVISHGQKNGHLELLGRFVTAPHVYLGHQGRSNQPLKRTEK